MQPFIEASKEILFHEQFMKSHDFIHHSDVSCRDHMIYVAYIAYKLHKPLNLPLSPLMKSALLHDLYLYDWHIGHPDSKGPIKLHGLFHPKKAYKNAKLYFELSSIEKNAIEAHMWPLTLFTIPRNKVAWALCFIDKFCALSETLNPKRRRWLKAMADSIYTSSDKALKLSEISF